MDRRRPVPWNPDHTWADLLITTFALLIILTVGVFLRSRPAQAPRPAQTVSLQGQLADMALAAQHLVPTTKPIAPMDPMPDLVAKARQGWDRALLAVHAAEKGDLALGDRLAQDAPGPGGDVFRRTWGWAYGDQGRQPTAAEMSQLRKALGNGYAADLLEARVVAKAGGDPKPLRDHAQAWALPRLVGLGAAGAGAFFLALGGLTFLVILLVNKAQPQPMPRFALSGRAVLIVLMGWFLTHVAASLIMRFIVQRLPFLAPVYLPLAYASHALLGLSYVCLAEGIGLRDLWSRMAPGRPGRALLTGLGFFAVAFAAVMIVAIVLSPFLHNAESPQRELLELLARLRGPLAVVLLFFTVAVVAPVFEEILFRGFMLPWLGERLEARFGRRWGWALAVTVTGLTFGAMHMQPAGLPTLGTLGIVLGFAFLRTGNLLTAILVHGLWNGGIFILMRFLA